MLGSSANLAPDIIGPYTMLTVLSNLTLLFGIAAANYACYKLALVTLCCIPTTVIGIVLVSRAGSKMIWF